MSVDNGVRLRIANCSATRASIPAWVSIGSKPELTVAVGVLHYHALFQVYQRASGFLLRCYLYGRSEEQFGLQDL